MYGQMLCVAMAALGVDVGWQSLPNGGVQYLIQIPPSLIQALENGQAIESDIRPEIQREIRSYRITVGTKTLPMVPPLESFSNSNSNGNIPAVVPNPMRSPGGPGGYSTPGGYPTPGGYSNRSRSNAPGPPGWPSLSPQPTSPTVPSIPTTPPSASGSGGVPSASGGFTLAERPPFLTDSPTSSGTSAAAGGTGTGESKSLASSIETGKRSPWGTSFLVALVALACSVSWNVYLLVLLREARRRYRNLLQRSGLTQDELDEEEETPEEHETADDDEKTDRSGRKGANRPNKG